MLTFLWSSRAEVFLLEQTSLTDTVDQKRLTAPGLSSLFHSTAVDPQSRYCCSLMLNGIQFPSFHMLMMLFLQLGKEYVTYENEIFFSRKLRNLKNPSFSSSDIGRYITFWLFTPP